MLNEPVRDHRGKVPNFLLEGKWMIHQPTGLRVTVESRQDRDLQRAQIELKKLIAQEK